MANLADIPLPLGHVLRIAEEYQRADRLDDADDLLARTLAVAPQQPDALHLAGLVAFRRGRFAEAAALVERALRHGVDTPLYWRNLCTMCERLGRYDEAEAAGQRAVALDPCDAGAYHNLTVVHYRRLDLDASIACARQAIALDPTLPGPHFALAEALLLRGEFAEGWEEYEWRFRIPGTHAPLPPTGRPAWGGAPMPNGNLLLVADQGFGDAIFFSRYLPWAAERCGKLALACSPDLAPLLRPAFPGVPMFVRWEDAPPFDAWQALSGLPRLRGTRLDTIPATPAYLRADVARVLAWGMRLKNLLPRGLRRIGIAWAGRPTHNNDGNRSASLAALGKLGDVPGVALVSLQKGPPAAQIGGYFGPAPLLNLGPELSDFADTAALLENLDAIVAVDTSILHLAAALGRPTFALLSFAPDWRWLLGRADSPWYPSVKLFRQPAPQDWRGPVAAAARALTAGSDGT
jgi:tetratricopeptide (TPR) repeat protein